MNETNVIEVLEVLDRSYRESYVAYGLLKQVTASSTAGDSRVYGSCSRLLSTLRTLQVEVDRLQALSAPGLADPTEPNLSTRITEIKLLPRQLDKHHHSNLKENLTIIFKGPPDPNKTNRQAIHRYNQVRTRCGRLRTLPPSSLALVCCLPPSAWKRANPAEFNVAMRDLHPAPDTWLDTRAPELRPDLERSDLQVLETYQQFKRAFYEQLERHRRAVLTDETQLPPSVEQSETGLEWIGALKEGDSIDPYPRRWHMVGATPSDVITALEVLSKPQVVTVHFWGPLIWVNIGDATLVFKREADFTGWMTEMKRVCRLLKVST